MNKDMGNSSVVFTGLADEYVQFRPRYPKAFLNQLLDFFHVDGSGRLLDLGCGPGTVTLDMRDRFQEVVGLDPNEDMFKAACLQKEREKAGNVQFQLMRAEDISEKLGSFQLVTCVSSFHWMDRRLVLQKAYQLLTDGGGIAIWGMGSFWARREKWQEIMIDIVKKYLGPERHGSEAMNRKPSHQIVVKEEGFKNVEMQKYPIVQTWDLERIMGYLYSSSFAAKELFGDRLPEFDREVREALQTFSPDDHFEDHITIKVIVGWK
ncbi:class I SAM-dependent methyltransferase [Shimazuella sp. AN120528]|uniref:class I SAM-dependent methyltransferase n=1 Tax=Shimazuella soli TaxID=1892854 RepID=UPI001F107F7D|nr:class I SAM-dependent methyltransferase [Shimazuella soli]MCH5584858.1 class I SAM-dependent methyltransferase [Shimazuella soli]